MENISDVNMDNKSRIIAALKCITVEPALCFYMYSSFLMWITLQALIYKKVCLHRYNDEICGNITHIEYEMEEDQIQTDASHWFLAGNLIFEIPSIFFSFVYGNVSDHVSRKLALLIPLIGQLFAATWYIINAAMFSLPIGVLLIGPLLSGCFGGWTGFCIAAFSYVSDDSIDKRRTIRIAIAESMINFSLALASFSGGIFLDRADFVAVFSTALVLLLAGCLYTWFGLREPTGTCTKVASVDSAPAINLGEHLRNTISPASIRRTARVVFRKRSMDRRKFIFLIFGTVLLVNFSLSPYRQGLAFLYVKRHPLSWSQTVYGYYTGYRLVLTGLALVTALPLLKKKARMRETSIMILTIVTSAISEIFFGLSTVTWMVFTGTLLAFLESCNTTCARSILSKLVDPDEFGQVFAVFGSVQMTSGILTTTLFNNVYPLTLQYWPGMCFAIGAALCIVPITILSYLHVQMRNFEKYSKLQERATDSTTCDINKDRDTTCGDPTEPDPTGGDLAVNTTTIATSVSI